MALTDHLAANTPQGKAGWGVGIGSAASALTAAFLMLHEGYEPVAKHERGDPPKVITWCYGRTNYDDPTVKPGTRFTKDQCKPLLEADIPKYAAPLFKCVKNFEKYPPHRQAALISFSYNVGPATACKSSAVQRLNAGDVRAGCDALMRYTRANGVVLRGLVTRRQDERAYCLRND